LSQEFILRAYCLSSDNFKQEVTGSKGEVYEITPNNSYSDEHDLNCTCPQFTYRNKKCKHIKMVEEWGFYCGWHCEFSEGLQEELGVCPKCKQPTGYEKWTV
jgi:hypothetical protein